MFGEQYYPTPDALVKKMLAQVNWTTVQAVLDPSAGKGTLLDAVKSHRHYIQTLAIEIDPVLRVAAQQAGHRVIDADFLEYQGGDSVDVILMNPPFNEGARHVLKAIELMSDSGGQIVALVNAETVRNPCTRERERLLDLLQDNNASIEFFENAFSTAERPAKVDVALVSCTLEPAQPETDYLDGLHAAVDDNAGVESGEPRDLVPGDRVEALVRSYEMARAGGLELLRHHKQVKHLLDGTLDVSCPAVPSRQRLEHDFLSSLRRSYWLRVLDMDSARKYLTSSTEKGIRGQIEAMSSLDFTRRNVHALLENLASSFSCSIESTIEETFDTLTTRFSYWRETERNYYLYNSWKSNSPKRVARKVIIPIKFWCDIFGRFSVNPYAEDARILDDVEKVMRFFSGGGEPGTPILHQLEEALNYGESKGVETEFFYVSLFKKGTVHLVFKDDDLLRRFNLWVGKRRQWLFRDYGDVPYSAMTEEQRREVDDFDGGKDGYRMTGGALCPALEKPDAIPALCVV